MPCNLKEVTLKSKKKQLERTARSEINASSLPEGQKEQCPASGASSCRVRQREAKGSLEKARRSPCPLPHLARTRAALGHPSPEARMGRMQRVPGSPQSGGVPSGWEMHTTLRMCFRK